MHIYNVLYQLFGVGLEPVFIKAMNYFVNKKCGNSECVDYETSTL